MVPAWRGPVQGDVPPGEFRAVTEQGQPSVGADERLLRGLFRQRGVTEAAPRDGIDAAFVALDQFAVTLGVAASHGGYRGFVLLRVLICALDHFSLHDLTERHQPREIVTRHAVPSVPPVG